MALAKDKDVRIQRRLAARAADFQARCRDRARAAFDDTTAGQWTETWADLTGWVTTGTPIQVSGGKVYSTGTGGSASGANHAISLGATETMRAVFILEHVPGGGSGITAIGFSKDAAGAAPAASVANGYAIGIPAASAGQVKRYNGGTSEDLGTAAAAGQWIVTVTVDSTYASVVARHSDGSLEFRGRWARSGININNLFIFMSDVRALTGQSISRVAMRRGIATMVPRALVEGIGASVQWSQLGTSGYRVALPKTYDSRVPNPVVVLFHGGGSDETHWADNANGSGVANAFLAAGYIVIGAAHTSNRTTYGAQISLDAYVTAFEEAGKLYNLGPVVVYGNSMGGIESLLALAEGRIPGVVAWIGSVPTASLEAAWRFTTGYLDRTAEITTAYAIAASTLSAAASLGATSVSSAASFAAGTDVIIGTYASGWETATVTGVTGSGPYALSLSAPLTAAYASGAAISDYPTKTAGHDPMRLDPQAFGGIPMYAVVATDDASVDHTRNWDVFSTRVAPYSTEMKRLDITGGHSSSSIAGNSASMVAFAKKYAPI